MQILNKIKCFCGYHKLVSTGWEKEHLDGKRKPLVQCSRPNCLKYFLIIDKHTIRETKGR